MRSNDGFILIVTLWTLLILSVLATGMAFRLSLDSRLSLYFLDELRAESIAKAGIFRALDMLDQDVDDFDSIFECGIRLKPGEKPQDFFENIPLGGGFFSVGYEEKGRKFSGMTDEDGKIDLNSAGETVLIALLTLAGDIRDPFLPREIAYNIIDWRDADHASSIQRGAEDNYYQSLPHPYDCSDRPFRTLEELLLVKDITPEIYEKIRKYVTVYGDMNTLRINLNTAPESVMQAIAVSVGFESQNALHLAERIIEWRSGSDRMPGTEDDVIVTSADIAALETLLPDLTSLRQADMIPSFKNFFKSDSSYYRIESVAGVSGSSVRKKISAIVTKKDDEERPKFLYYHQE